MGRRHPAPPVLWLITDARNDARLDRTLARLPRGSGLIFRHYHLEQDERRARFDRLLRIARRLGHVVLLAGSPGEARRWRADGVYGTPMIGRGGIGRWRVATAHSLAEIATVNRLRADAVLLSPVFPTRSHPGASILGVVRFRLIAKWARMPVVALGGMNAARARAVRWRNWAAIDGI